MLARRRFFLDLSGLATLRHHSITEWFVGSWAGEAAGITGSAPGRRDCRVDRDPPYRERARARSRAIASLSPQLCEAVPPHAVDSALRAYCHNDRLLAAAVKGTGAVGRAMRGAALIARRGAVKSVPDKDDLSAGCPPLSQVAGVHLTRAT